MLQSEYQIENIYITVFYSLSEILCSVSSITIRVINIEHFFLFHLINILASPFYSLHWIFLWKEGVGFLENVGTYLYEGYTISF